MWTERTWQAAIGSDRIGSEVLRGPRRQSVWVARAHWSSRMALTRARRAKRVEAENCRFSQMSWLGGGGTETLSVIDTWEAPEGHRELSSSDGHHGAISRHQGVIICTSSVVPSTACLDARRSREARRATVPASEVAVILKVRRGWARRSRKHACASRW